jgi:YVTN family beta-propeller protein
MATATLDANTRTSGAGTEDIDVSPSNARWATNRGSNTVSIIDVASSKIVATLHAKSFPFRAKFTDVARSRTSLVTRR